MKQKRRNVAGEIVNDLKEMQLTLKSSRPLREKSTVRLPLANAFPLRPIRDEDDYDRAAETLGRLVLRDDLTADEDDYLQVLTLIVSAYDSKFWRQEPDARKPLRKLKS